MKLRITAPMRVDIGGGVTDVPQFSEEIGTAVVNIALDLYKDPGFTLPANVGVEISDTQRVENRLFFNDRQYGFDSRPGEDLYFIKKIILKQLSSAASARNFDIAIFNTLPPGTGLGGSAVLSLCLFTALQLFYARRNSRPSPRVILEAHEFETIDLGIKGGFQDYIAAYFGGCNYINFPSLAKSELVKASTLGLTIPSHIEQFLNESMLVVILNEETISSSQIVQDEVENFYADKQGVGAHLLAIKEHNAKLYEIMYQKKISDMPSAIGVEMNQSWAHHKQLSSLIARSLLKDIEKTVQPLTYGLRGPGAAGNSLFLLAKPENKDEVIAYLSSLSHEITVLYPQVNQTGLRVISVE